MNKVRVNGEIVSEIRLRNSVKKQCKQADFLLAAPFTHPFPQHVEISPNYRAIMRTIIYGEKAEWAYDNLYEGAHFEMRQGFLQSWWANGRSYYRLVGHTIAIDRCGERPDDYEPWNKAYFSGDSSGVWCREYTESGALRVGLTVSAPPDTQFADTRYCTRFQAILYGDLAEYADGKLEKGALIDYMGGTLQPVGYRKDGRMRYGVYLIVTDLHI